MGNPQTKSRISDAVARFGVARVARTLGMSRESVLAIAAGAGTREGTQLLADTRVDRLAGLEGGEATRS